MNDSSNVKTTVEQVDGEILTATVSDEALETAGAVRRLGTERAEPFTTPFHTITTC